MIQQVFDTSPEARGSQDEGDGEEEEEARDNEFDAGFRRRVTSGEVGSWTKRGPASPTILGERMIDGRKGVKWDGDIRNL